MPFAVKISAKVVVCQLNYSWNNGQGCCPDCLCLHTLNRYLNLPTAWGRQARVAQNFLPPILPTLSFITIQRLPGSHCREVKLVPEQWRIQGEGRGVPDLPLSDQFIAFPLSIPKIIPLLHIFRKILGCPLSKIPGSAPDKPQYSILSSFVNLL